MLLQHTELKLASRKQRHVKDENIFLKNEHLLFSYMWLIPEKVAEKYKTNTIQDLIYFLYKILYIEDAAVRFSGCFRISLVLSLELGINV